MSLILNKVTNKIVQDPNAFKLAIYFYYGTIEDV